MFCFAVNNTILTAKSNIYNAIAAKIFVNRLIGWFFKILHNFYNVSRKVVI